MKNRVFAVLLIAFVSISLVALSLLNSFFLSTTFVNTIDALISAFVLLFMVFLLGWALKSNK